MNFCTQLLTYKLKTLIVSFFTTACQQPDDHGTVSLISFLCELGSVVGIHSLLETHEKKKWEILEKLLVRYFPFPD